MQDDFDFCTNCGKKHKRNNVIGIFVGLAGAILVVSAVFALTIIQKNSLKSPIEGVSKRVYVQGQEYLEKMDTDNVKKVVMQYADSDANSSVPMKEIHEHIDEVDFEVNVGKDPTNEEIYYAKVIDKFWESKSICYAHRAIMAQYKNSDESAEQMAATLYKGKVSDFEDSIDEAREVFEKALDMEDMEEAYQILDSIWESLTIISQD